jgi:hypothetical protein
MFVSSSGPLLDGDAAGALASSDRPALIAFSGKPAWQSATPFDKAALATKPGEPGNDGRQHG